MHNNVCFWSLNRYRCDVPLNKTKKPLRCYIYTSRATINSSGSGSELCICTSIHYSGKGVIESKFIVNVHSNTKITLLFQKCRMKQIRFTLCTHTIPIYATHSILRRYRVHRVSNIYYIYDYSKLYFNNQYYVFYDDNFNISHGSYIVTISFSRRFASRQQKNVSLNTLVSLLS